MVSAPITVESRCAMSTTVQPPLTSPMRESRACWTMASFSASSALVAYRSRLRCSAVGLEVEAIRVKALAIWLRDSEAVERHALLRSFSLVGGEIANEIKSMMVKVS